MGTSNQDCGVLFHCSSLEKFLEIHLVAVKKERGVELLYSRCCHPHQAFSLSLSCHRHKIFSLFPHTYLCTLRRNSLLRNNSLVKNDTNHHIDVVTQLKCVVRKGTRGYAPPHLTDFANSPESDFEYFR